MFLTRNVMEFLKRWRRRSQERFQIRFVKRSMVTQPMASVTDMECSVDLVLTVGSLGKEVTQRV